MDGGSLHRGGCLVGLLVTAAGVVPVLAAESAGPAHHLHDGGVADGCL
ncbi:hypothetical protein [Kitasatospora sp. NPDC056531]